MTRQVVNPWITGVTPHCLGADLRTLRSSKWPDSIRSGEWLMIGVGMCQSTHSSLSLSYYGSPEDSEIFLFSRSWSP